MAKRMYREAMLRRAIVRRGLRGTVRVVGDDGEREGDGVERAR